MLLQRFTIGLDFFRIHAHADFREGIFNFFEFEVPAVLREAVLSDCDERIVDIARERIFRTSSVYLPLTSNISRLWGKRGWIEKARIFLGNAFPSRDFLATVYPVDASSPRVFLYYPVRLKDLMVRQVPQERMGLQESKVSTLLIFL